MIEVEHLTKRFGTVTAVDDVTFRVEKGEILGFLGPNGAGKTTTMRVLAGFFPATDGTARVAGYDVFEEPMEAKRRVGYLPENPPLYLELSVDAFLRFTASIRGLPRSEVESRLSYVKERCGLQEWGHRLIKHLSKGFRQRVGLAQALIHDPQVLILDEPTVGLDPNQIIEVRGLIRSLAGDHTVILSTHILPEVEMTCQRVVIINDGRITAMDTPENLGSRGQAAARVELIVGAPGNGEQVASLLSMLESLEHVDNVARERRGDGRHELTVTVSGSQDLRPLLARSVIDAGLELYRLERKTMSLEEVFVELTTEEPRQAEPAADEAPAPAPAETTAEDETEDETGGEAA